MDLYSPRIGYLTVGRDPWRDFNGHIGVGLVRRHDAKEGDIAWRFCASVSWNWPRLVYKKVSPAPNVPGSSSAWTGREWRLAGIDWRYARVNTSWNFIPRRV